jgi:hypothetical protein
LYTGFVGNTALTAGAHAIPSSSVSTLVVGVQQQASTVDGPTARTVSKESIG